MTVTASRPVPVPGSNLADEPTLDIPAQRGPLGNRDQVDDRGGNVRPSDLLPYRRPSNSPAVELGKRAYDLMARNDRVRKPSTVEGIAAALEVEQADLMVGIAAFLTASTGVEIEPATSFLQAEETVWWNQPEDTPVPANVPAPTWSTESSHGSHQPGSNDPGTSHHYGEQVEIATTDPDGRDLGSITVNLERFDFGDTEGRTSIWLDISTDDAGSMSLDQAEALALAILAQVRTGRGETAA